MCMGVATANSILMVSFAREQMDEGIPAVQAAVAAGYTRVRPVLMTALAMIIGMVPMALKLARAASRTRHSAVRSSADCSSLQSPLYFLCRACSPCSTAAVKPNERAGRTSKQHR